MSEENYSQADSRNSSREALLKIAELVKTALEGGQSAESEPGNPGCTIKSLPTRLLKTAAETARAINPLNAPVFGPMAAVADGVMSPLMIAVITSKYWGTTPRQLTVSFLEPAPDDLKARILREMNAWSNTCCISFVSTAQTGEVRISREGNGYWSYLGTDIRHIPKSRPTMNLQGFTMQTRDSEYKRVVRHETGHTLGFPHEHMRRDLVARIDPQKAYDWFLRNQGWDKATVDAQVLTSLDERSLMATPPDQTSIMCYQLPGSIMKNGKGIPGGTDINPTDYAFAGRIYPKPGRQASDGAMGEDWPEGEDGDGEE